MDMTVEDATDAVLELSDEDWQKFFSAQAQRVLGMSGDQFIQAYRAGRWPDPDAYPGVVYLLSLLPSI